MIDLNATLLVQMINFAIFLFILRKILFKPLVNHIQERRNYLSSTEQKISQIIAKIEEAERNYQIQLDTARKRAQDLINKNIALAEEENYSIINAAITETRKVFADFHSDLEYETKIVRANLPAEVETLAQEIARKILTLNSPDEKLLVQGGNK